MTATIKTLTEQNIRDLSEAKVFERGYQYFNEGRAKIESQSRGKIEVVVQGTQQYGVSIKHTSKQFEASCHCPAAQNFDFCKHCVAASLAYLELLTHKASLKKHTGEDLLKAYLGGLPKDQLVDTLSEHIRRNPITLQNWMLKAETAAEKLDAKSLKKHITAAIPYNRHLHSYSQAQSYFRKIEALLERLQLEFSRLDAEDVLKLVDYAITRIRRALDTVDDSGGFRDDSLEQLSHLHRQALKESEQTHQQKADYLLRIYLGDNVDFYPDIPNQYVDVLETATLNTFYQRLQQRWDALPTLNPEGDDQRHFDRKLDYLHTVAPLLNKARDDGDIAAEIAYLEKCATSVRDMITISELYAEFGNIKVANQWLMDAQALSEKSGFRADRGSILDQKVELLILENNPGLALSSRWEHFAESPSFESYCQLRDLAKRLDDNENWYTRSVTLLQEVSSAEGEESKVGDLVRIHLAENNFEDAIEIALDHPLHPELLAQVAVSQSVALNRVLPLVDRVFEHYVSRKNLQGYEAAVGFLEGFYLSRKKREQRQIITFAKTKIGQHKPKKNLASLLEKTFSIE